MLFLEVHDHARSVMVNIDEIQYIDGDTVCFTGGATIKLPLLGRVKLEEILEKRGLIYRELGKD